MSPDRADAGVNSVSRDGLRKMKEVADAMQTLDDPNLAEHARQALQNQVVRTATVRGCGPRRTRKLTRRGCGVRVR